MSVRRELVLDTDSASFTLAVLVLLGSAGMAAIEWWAVVHARGSVHRAGWQEYLALLLGVWMLVDLKGQREFPRAARFALGVILSLLALKITVSFVAAPDEILRAVSLWSALTVAIVAVGMCVWSALWLWRKLQDG
jgi:hypothetical protein